MKPIKHIQRVGELRRKKNLTLADLAQCCGLVASTIYRIENGRDVKLSVMRKVSDYLGKPIEYLWPKHK